MPKTVQDVMSMIQENAVQMVDIHGQYRHATIPARDFSEELMTEGVGFDASNYGYAVVEKIDMVFLSDPDTAILTASLDGIQNRIDPHENGWGPYDCNLFELPEEEKKKLKGLPTSLEEALDALEADHDYLTAGGVFPEVLLKNFIKTKRAEVRELSKIPHPAEFENITTCKR